MRKGPKKIPTPPDELVDAVAKGCAMLFAGAGVSRGRVKKREGTTKQHLPTWDRLLAELLRHAAAYGRIPKDEAASLRIAIKEQKHEFVGEMIRRRMGEADYEQALESIFRDPKLEPTKRHDLIVALPFAGIITTNYDKLLESSYARHRSLPPTYTFEDAADAAAALSHGRFFVLKAHGDIDRKKSIVLTQRDYRDVTHRQPGYRAVLNAIFITKTVLFVGCSMTDPDINLILETVTESLLGKGPPHYALVPEREAKAAYAEFWRDFYGIRLLQYDATKDHPEIETFLIKLKQAVESRIKKRR